MMKPILISALIGLFALGTFGDDPMELLQKAKDKMNNSGYVQYRYTYLWPNPADIVDTLSGVSTFSKKDNLYYPYNFISSDGGSDLFYIDNVLKQISHEEKTISLWPDDDDSKRMVTQCMPVQFSPLTFLNASGWSFLRDTVIQNVKLHIYSRVEMDKVIETNHVVIKTHMFINTTTALVDRCERRGMSNNKLGQLIVFQFSDYKLKQQPEPLTVALPDGYRSKMFNDDGGLVLLKEGQPAPAFTLTDLNGKAVSLESFQGKKVLLDFSVIGCGYCKLALDHLDKPGYKMSDKINALYVNPQDKRQSMNAFMSKVKIPYPVLVDAKEVARAYGVSGYPTFFLIDEKGVIEKVQVGYDKAFIDSLQ